MSQEYGNQTTNYWLDIMYYIITDKLLVLSGLQNLQFCQWELLFHRSYCSCAVFQKSRKTQYADLEQCLQALKNRPLIFCWGYNAGKVDLAPKTFHFVDSNKNDGKLFTENGV